MQRRLSRNEIPTELTWNLNDLFATSADWDSELIAVENEIGSVTQFQGHLHEGADRFRACFDAMELLTIRVGRVASYASLRSAEDGTNPENQGCAARSNALLAKIGAALSFIRTEVLALSDGTVEQYIKEEPTLLSLQHFIAEMLKSKPHTLYPETERALAALGEVLRSPGAIYSRAKSSDIRFQPIAGEDGSPVELSFALCEEILESAAPRSFRQRVWDSFVKGLIPYRNTFAATFATEIRKNVTLARLRHYPSATEMLLHPQQVTLAVYENVLDMIQLELAPHFQRYARLRKRVMSLDQLHYHDIKAPLDPEYNPTVTYAEGCEMILEALAILGPEYLQIISSALSERWVDRAENIGKSTGAFCASPYGLHSYILMTWNDSMRNVFTLAHELGHAGHFGLAGQNQRMLNTRPSLFFIEAPSTMNELLLANHLMQKSLDPRMRRWVLMQLLDTYHHNYVTHLLEGELQRRIYALAESGQPVTESTLTRVNGEILSRFWGDTLTIDEGAQLTWMRQPHYYMGLYPYTYAAGLTAATALVGQIREEGQPAVDRWLQTLKAGSTLPPQELMQLAGVNISEPSVIRKAVADVGSLVTELERSF